MIQYQSCKFKEETLKRIQQANEIIAAYRTQGLDLTLRQLYYQFVSRNLIKNDDKEYGKLGDVIAKGRLAGLIDWEAIVDRTRYVRKLAHWDSPQEIVDVCAKQFRVDKWQRQPQYVEVWIEKDALIGVIEGVCTDNDVPYLACRGFASVSEVWRAGRDRIAPRLKAGKDVTIVYLGDHDPSGIDMTRDVRERLQLFAGNATEYADLHVERIALNMDQVELYAPPPNPTKATDSRSGPYIEQYGESCWELDALDPIVIRDLVEAAIHSRRDDGLWGEALAEEKEAKKHLAGVAGNWDAVVAALPADDEPEPDLFEDV